MEGGKLRLRPEIHGDASAADEEIGGELALWRRHHGAVALRPRIRPRRAGMEDEIAMGGAAIIGRLREALAQAEDAGHEAPAPGIVEIGEMLHEAAEGDPAIGLDDLRL